MGSKDNAYGLFGHQDCIWQSDIGNLHRDYTTARPEATQYFIHVFDHSVLSCCHDTVISV